MLDRLARQLGNEDAATCRNQHGCLCGKEGLPVRFQIAKEPLGDGHIEGAKDVVAF